MSDEKAKLAAVPNPPASSTNGSGAAAGQKPAAAKPVPPRTAGQRLDDLEKGLGQLFQNLDNLFRDSNVQRDAVKLLGNKVDALAKAIRRSEEPTDDTLSKIMIENNVEELKGKVDNLVKAKILVATDIVGKTSFVVGRELEADSDKIINPRLQFALTALQKEVGEKIDGHLVGDIIVVEEGKARFEVLEVYNIQAPPQPQAVAPAATSTETDVTATAPAAQAAQAATPAATTPAPAAQASAPAVSAPAATPAPAASTDSTTAAAPTSN